MDIETEYKIALDEIGPIEPIFEFDYYYFEHELYPVVIYAADTKEDCIGGYKYALRHYLLERMAGNIAPSMEAITKGKAGKPV